MSNLEENCFSGCDEGKLKTFVSTHGSFNDGSFC